MLHAAALLPAAHASVQLSEATACVQPKDAAPCEDRLALLPFYWDRDHGADHGQARFTLRFAAKSVAALSGATIDAPALFLPRVGNAFSVALNGQTLFAVGDADTRQHDSVKRPYLISLPASLIQAEGNVLQVTIFATAGRAAQLAPMQLGNRVDLEEAFEREYFWRVQLTAALMWTAILLGLMGLSVWLVQREPMFLSYGIAEIAWGLRLADMFFIEMPLPWQQWGAGVAVVFGVSQLAMTHFFLNAVGRWQGRWRRGFWIYTALWCAMVPLIVLGELREVWIGWVALGATGYVAVALFVGWQGFRERHRWRWLFASFVLTAAVAGFLDVLESPGSMYMHPTWARLVWAVYGLALATLVARRLLLARRAQQAANETLRSALAAQAVELDEANRQRARAELERAMEQERQRVMRDMHDVLGGRLSGLLSLAGRQGPAAAELQSQVRMAMQELREVVDAMSPFDGNLATMLGSLRPQLERRLSLVGIALDWSVDELPTTDELTPVKVQHLRLLLLEAATNVARHSKATRATLSARLQGGVIELQLADDGVGFDMVSAQALGRGNGLRNMQWRARALGAEFDAICRTGTTLTLRLRVADT